MLKSILKNLKWLAETADSAAIPTPEETYRLKKIAEIKTGFEVYVLEMDEYLIKNNINGRIKIPRWTKEFYLLPKVYMGRELIWGDKWSVHPTQGGQ